MFAKDRIADAPVGDNSVNAVVGLPALVLATMMWCGIDGLNMAFITPALLARLPPSSTPETAGVAGRLVLSGLKGGFIGSISAYALWTAITLY